MPILFTFGPGDSYYINNGRQSCWLNIPAALVTLLRDDIRCSPDKITSLALFPDDGYFLSAVNGMWATNNVPATIQGRITADIGGKDNVKWIQHDNADASRYQIFALSGPGRAKSFHSSQPTNYFNTIAAEIFAGVTFTSTGYNGNWVLGLSDQVYSSLDDENVRKMVMAPGKTIQDVTLSPYTAGHVFVEYADGSTNYLLPTSWHDAIRTMDVGARQPQVANVGVVSNVVKQVGMEVGKEAGKEIGKEVGKELIGALFQSASFDNNSNNNYYY